MKMSRDSEHLAIDTPSFDELGKVVPRMHCEKIVLPMLLEEFRYLNSMQHE